MKKPVQGNPEKKKKSWKLTDIWSWVWSSPSDEEQPETAQDTQELFRSKHSCLLKWPSQSPGLISIGKL